MRRYALKYLYSLLFAGACISVQGFAQQPLTGKTVKVDSLPAAVSGKVNAEVKRIGNEMNQLPSKAKQSVLEIIAPEKKLMDSLLGTGKNIAHSILSPVKLFKPGTTLLKINTINADIDYTYLRDTSGLSTGIFKNIQTTIGYNFAINLSVANMPFDARLAGNNGIYSFYNTPFNNFPQFNFNHKKYLELLQKQVLDKISPERVLASVLSRINAVKSQYESSLKNEIKNIQHEFEMEFHSELKLAPNITDLSVNDLASLKNVVIPQGIADEYKQGTEIYQELTSAGTNNPAQNDSLKRRALQSIKKYEALGKIYTRITGWKEKFDSNPLVKELRSHLPFTPGNFKSFIKKPANLTDIIKGNASLSGIQQLFLNITKLDVGVNPVSGGGLNIENMMNNGINTELTGKHSSVGFIYGSGKVNTNNWLQAGLNSFGSNEYSKLTGIKFGSGWNSSIKQSISLNFFDFNTSQDITKADLAILQPGSVSNPARRDAVITWQSSFDIAANHKISVDLSKSFGSYRNNFSDDSTTTKNNAFADVFGNGGKSNYAAAIDYSGNILKTDVQLSLKKAGLGYNNPGDVFARRGESRIGLGINRKLLKQKLTIRYKTDFRSQHFDPSKKYTYTNFSNNLQLGYRLKRNSRFGLTLRHNSYRFNNGLITPVHGASFILQGDANYLFRIKGKKVINNFSLSRQRFDIPMLAGAQYTSKTWLITQSSSLVLGKNLMTLTLLMNQSDNKEYYFNTSFFNTEINYAYAAGEKIRLGSGIGFYSNTGWNKQIGLKQQINGTIFKKLDIDIDITWKKAVKTIRTELANQVFISSSVHYRF